MNQSISLERVTENSSNQKVFEHSDDALSKELIKKIPVTPLQESELSEWSDNENWWWKREYQIVIAEEK